MKWVTRDFVHLDRVASPWLIRRFVDPEAEFAFVPWGSTAADVVDGIPFALPGAELGPHDEHGPTFVKILTRYGLDDPALQRIGRVVALGVDAVLHGYRPDRDDTDGQTAMGLLAISEGMMLAHDGDRRILEDGFVVYDALYANFRAHALVAERGLTVPPADELGPTRPTRFLRAVLRDAGQRT